MSGINSSPIFNNSPAKLDAPNTVESQQQLSIDAAVKWWIDYLKKSFTTENLKKFENNLKEAILLKIKDHWYPDSPSKGQGYRSLSMDKRAHCDPLLTKAASGAGSIEPFVSFFKDLDSIHMWIDPDIVVVRLSYTGYISIPPEEKVLYRSQLPKKTSPPPSPNRSSFQRPQFRPPSPAQSYLPFRPNSPAHHMPITYPYPQQPKNPYMAQPTALPRNGIYYNNNSINQSQYLWYNGHPTTAVSSPDWNEKNYSSGMMYQNVNYGAKPPTGTPQFPPQVYSEYYPELPLETQA